MLLATNDRPAPWLGPDTREAPAGPELDAGLEGTTARFEEIRLAVVFFLSQDEHCERHEHSGGNSDQGPHSDNPLAVLMGTRQDDIY